MLISHYFFSFAIAFHTLFLLMTAISLATWPPTLRHTLRQRHFIILRHATPFIEISISSFSFASITPAFIAPTPSDALAFIFAIYFRLLTDYDATPLLMPLDY